MAASKFGAFKRFFHGLNLPRELLGMGGLILAVNVTIPIMFRKGLDTDNELWTIRSQYCWYIFLPLLLFLGNILPNPNQHTKCMEAHKQRWIPLISFLMWMTGTAVHLYTIGYVDQQKFGVGNISVLLWAATWLMLTKGDHLFASIKPEYKTTMLVLPAAETLLSIATNRPSIFIILNLLNTVVFALIARRRPGMKLPAVLGGASLVAAFIGIPEHWAGAVIRDFNKAEILTALAALAGLWVSLRSRTAKGGLIGSASVAILAVGLCHKFALSPHIIVQALTIYYLLHSLRWGEQQEYGSTFSLVAMSLIWIIDSFSFGQSGSRLGNWVPTSLALILMLGAAGWKYYRHKLPVVLFSAAIFVLLMNPVYRVIVWFTNAPAGLLALLASFGLFAIGTGFALWKRRIVFHSSPDHATS